MSECTSHTDVKDSAYPTPLGDTLEFSISAADFRDLAAAGGFTDVQAAALAAERQSRESTAPGSAPTGPTGIATPGAKPTLSRLEAKTASLARSLAMLKDIRMKQQEYIKLLLDDS